MPGLEDLYREIILDHYRTPRNRGELEPPAVKIDGHNPLCGDEISVYLAVDGTGDDAIVNDIKIGGQGCSISQSSASMMTKAVMGKSVGEINAGEQVLPGDIINSTQYSYSVFTLPAIARMHEFVCQITRSRKDQQAFGVEIKPPYRNPSAGLDLRQLVKDGRPFARVIARTNQTGGFVHQQYPRGRRQWLALDGPAIHSHLIFRANSLADMSGLAVH